MARTARAVAAIVSAGALNNLTAVDSANGETMPYSSGRAFLEVLNGSGGSINVTIRSAVSVDGQPTTNNDRVVAVAAAARKRIGLQGSAFLQADGNVYVDYSASASVTAEACSV
jgi:hypothetical protein